MIFHSISADVSVRASDCRRNSLVLSASNLHKLLLAGGLAILLSACDPSMFKKPVEEAPPPPVVEPVVEEPQFSSEPIVKAPKDLVRYAQTVLSKLGYRIGGVDGLWGPRSARAIRAFEAQQQIDSADGHISELNLHHLSEVSGYSQADFVEDAKKVKKPAGITAKLNKNVRLESGPQLIIVEREYKVFSKPNPYSATLAKIKPGTGIYVVARESGWYKIESLNRLRGYVRVD